MNRNRRTYIVSISYTDGRYTTGEFKTKAGAEGRADWARKQADVSRVITNF
jgi:hypothetical protein